MPSIFLQIQNMRVNGPVVPVKIDLPAKAREILARSSQFVPSPIRVFGLVDTGATSTCISSKVCQQLAL